MTTRTWLYSQLLDSRLQPLIGDRVFAKKSMTSSVEETPYIVYKLGHGASAGLSEDIDPNRQFIQVFVHDYSDGQVADYMRIDEVIRVLRDVLKNASGPEDGVITTQYLETSQDLNDETLNTVMKYVRFQLITEEKS